MSTADTPDEGDTPVSSDTEVGAIIVPRRGVVERMSTVYLTIDDAPSDDLSEKISVLERSDVPALFFCEGRRLVEHPAQARRAVESGFHIGNHAYSHQRASNLSIEEFRDEIANTEHRIEDIYDRASVARPARLFRFPYGDTGGDTRDSFQRVLREWDFVPPDTERISCERSDYRTGDRDWFWTFTAEDWLATTEDELRQRFDAARLGGSSPDIALFHDSGNSVELFTSFIDLLRSQDVSFGDPLELLVSE